MRFYAKMEKSKTAGIFDFVDSDTTDNAKIELEKRHFGYKASGLGEYLVESKIFHYLKENFPSTQIIYDKPLSEETLLTKNINPDFRIESIKLKGVETKLIIEFDGPQHYTSALEALKDKKKDEIYNQLGYKVIRFPYFIQLKREIVDYYFGENMPCDNSYKHGFVDKKALLPADFCSLGIERFILEIEFYSTIDTQIVTDIIETIKEKIKNKIKTNNKWKDLIEKSVVSEVQIDLLKKYGW